MNWVPSDKVNTITINNKFLLISTDFNKCICFQYQIKKKRYFFEEPKTISLDKSFPEVIIDSFWPLNENNKNIIIANLKNKSTPDIGKTKTAVSTQNSKQIDSFGTDDVQIKTYIADIFKYLQTLEKVVIPLEVNMNQSYDRVINDLIKFHERLNLLPEILYLALNIFRRFLSVKQAADYK